MQPRDAVSLALILNCKGVVEVGLYCFLYDTNVIDGLASIWSNDFEHNGGSMHCAMVCQVLV